MSPQLSLQPALATPAPKAAQGPSNAGSPFSASPKSEATTAPPPPPKPLRTRNRPGACDACSPTWKRGDIAASNSSGSDLGRTLSTSKAYTKGGAGAKVAVVHGLNRPLFHIDLTSALQSAIANVEMRGEGEVRRGVGTEEN